MGILSINAPARMLGLSTAVATAPTTIAARLRILIAADVSHAAVWDLRDGVRAANGEDAGSAKAWQSFDALTTPHSGLGVPIGKT